MDDKVRYSVNRPARDGSVIEAQDDVGRRSDHLADARAGVDPQPPGGARPVPRWGTEKESLAKYEPFLAAEPSIQKERS